MSLTKDNIFALLEPAAFGAYAVSSDQTILFWNRAAERILGYKSEEVLGRRCCDVVSGPDATTSTAECAQGCPSLKSLQGGGWPRQSNLRVWSSSGECKIVSFIPVIVGGTGDEAVCVIHLFTDESVDAGPVPGSVGGAEVHPTTGPADGYQDSPSRNIAPSRSRLTGRELEVLRLVSLGWETRRIANELNISPHTVLNHIRHFRRKLNAPTKLDAVVTAIREGILPIG